MSEPVEIVELRPQRAVVMRRTVARHHLGEFFMEVYPKISAAITAAGATQAGPPYSRYYNEDPSAFDVEAGIPFTGANPSGKDMRVIELPGGRAAKTLHIGSYETLHTEYTRIGGWAEQGGVRLAGGPGSPTSTTTKPPQSSDCGPRCTGRWPRNPPRFDRISAGTTLPPSNRC